MVPKCLYVIAMVLSLTQVSNAQDSLGFFQSDGQYRPGRFWALNGTIGVSYTAAVVGLNALWYKNTPKSNFQFFNDWNEWQNMDKYGHFMTAYQYSRVASGCYQWAGINRNKAVWIGVGLSNALQATVELMDAFSAKWGFSVADMLFNAMGSFGYATQEWSWGEQRIQIKLSTSRRQYPDMVILGTDGRRMLLSDRTNELFGKQFSETVLKDYNAQTYWLSINPVSFSRKKASFWPVWLNVALGIGSENLFGGFENRWTDEQGNSFVLDEKLFPRYRQYYLSLDIDLSKIKTKSSFLKAILSGINFIKIPAPAIEINKIDGVVWHWIHY